MFAGLRGVEFGSVLDTISYEFTESGVAYTYVCYPQYNGISKTETKWAIQRVAEVTVGAVTTTNVRWAKKPGVAGKGAYFQFRADEYRDADGFFGD